MARVSREEKDRSRARIVGSASKLLRERGVEGASVNDVMRDAGLTHGGFYRHFATKEAMVKGALDAAFEEIIGLVGSDVPNRSAADAARHFREFYLSDIHLQNAGRGCPAAALAGEIARAPDATRARFGAGVRAMLIALAGLEQGDEGERQVAATRELAMLVGALALARASDAGTADLILAACRGPAPVATQ